MKKVYCYYCCMEVETEKTTVCNTYEIRGELVNVEEKIEVCQHCKQEVMVSENILSNQMYNINNEYLKLHNLSFEKIKQLRLDLELSQEEFAKKLGWSKKTIVRYENGQSLPQGEYLRFYEKLAENRNYFYERTGNYNDKLLEINKKGINAILYVLQDNALGITSIMKHLFGVDFLSLKKFGDQVTNFEYARLPHGPVINNYKNLINLMLLNGLIEWDVDDDGHVIYIVNEVYNNDVFSDEDLQCLSFIKNKMSGKTANELSEWSHHFIGWKETASGAIIDSKYADFINFDNL